MRSKAKKIGIVVAIITATIMFIFFSIKDKNIKNNLDTNINTDLITASSSVQTQTEEYNNKNTQTKNMNEENKNYTEATLNTKFGKIKIQLSKDKPLTTENFIKLAKSGFYNGVKFHRVISGFMIQTGDPLSKDESQKMYWGTGGPGYKFQDELTGNEKYTIGTVAMANSGPNTNGSQFFIMTSNTNLPPLYTVFGKVVAGQDVAQKIDGVATDASDKPLDAVVINSIDLK